MVLEKFEADDIMAYLAKRASNAGKKVTIVSSDKDFLQLVDSKVGHPVRSGNKSWRFEVREGDCGGDKKYSDCKSDRQRTELQTKEYQKRNKEYWYSASIYLPEDYISVAPVRTVFTQIYEKGWKPILMITDRSSEWLEVGRMWSGEYVEMKKGIKINDMKGKWTDILINVRYTRKEDGFMKVWINNKLILESFYFYPTSFHQNNLNDNPKYFKTKYPKSIMYQYGYSTNNVSDNDVMKKYIDST